MEALRGSRAGPPRTERPRFTLSRSGRGFRIDGGPLPEPDQLDPAGLDVVRRCPFGVWEKALRYLELHAGMEGAGRVLLLRIALDGQGRPKSWGSGVVPPAEHCGRRRPRKRRRGVD